MTSTVRKQDANGGWRLAHRLALGGLGAPAVASSRPHASQLSVWGALLAHISDGTLRLVLWLQSRATKALILLRALPRV